MAMADREKAIRILEQKYSSGVFRSKDELIPVTDIIALLKQQDVLTVKPKLLDRPNKTKAWLDEMDAVDALGNIANICMDFDGYRTANGLGELINEVRTYAKYCADKLKAREQQHDYETSIEMVEYCERYEPTYNPEDGSM